MKPTPLLLAALAVLPLAACGKAGGATLPAPAASSEPAAIGVKTVRAKTDVAQVVRATGELRARNEATLSSEVSGRILRFHADVGDRVRKGDVLVELADSTARIQLQQARAAKAAADAALRNAQNDHKRMKELASGDAAAPASLERAAIAEEQATASRDQAAAAVAGAEDQLAKHVLRAPFDGIVTARTKSAGEYVAMMPPTPVMALVDVASVEVRAAVPETVVDLLSPGAELDATVSPSGKGFKARIRAIGASVDPATRTVDVRAVPAGAHFRELRPGALVELALGGKGAKVEGVFLPADVVQAGDAGAFVWTVESDRLKKRNVQVEKLGPGTVRVVSGVGPGDLVVAEGGGALADGAKVRVLQ
jgi:RND family efflux transporter MFP subunit